jgi:hypothetical protein
MMISSDKRRRVEPSVATGFVERWATPNEQEAKLLKNSGREKPGMRDKSEHPLVHCDPVGDRPVAGFWRLISEA